MHGPGQWENETTGSGSMPALATSLGNSGDLVRPVGPLSPHSSPLGQAFAETHGLSEDLREKRSRRLELSWASGRTIDLKGSPVAVQTPSIQILYCPLSLLTSLPVMSCTMNAGGPCWATRQGE